MDDGASAALPPNASAKAAIVRRMEEVIELTADFMASYPTTGNTSNLEVELQVNFVARSTFESSRRRQPGKRDLEPNI